MTQKILAIDTSSEACSVALNCEGEVVERFTDQPRKHAELVLPMVDEVLSEAGFKLDQLDAIAFGQGPGSFTGLRIAAGTVQGLAFGADLPVVPISSLASLAHRAYRENGWQHIHVALDARMSEVYWGSYSVNEKGQANLIGLECVCKPEQVVGAANVQVSEGFFGVGSGWVYKSQLEPFVGTLKDCDSALLPHARDVLDLALLIFAQAGDSNRAGLLAAHEVAPVYLRNNVAAKPSAKNK